jgi:hypothetical protein
VKISKREGQLRASEVPIGSEIGGGNISEGFQPALIGRLENRWIPGNQMRINVESESRLTYRPIC